jgi:hypothetical protein
MTGDELLAKTVENFLDYLDWCSDESERRGICEISLDKWFLKLNKAVDAYNRQQAGIPPAAPFGRPLGSTDRTKRKSRTF